MAESERRPTAFKDYFDRAAARALGKQVAAVEPSFDVAAFVRKATRGLLELEFADRVRNFSEALAAQLPGGPESLQVLTRSLPEPLPNADSVTDGFLQWPIGQYIADHGVGAFLLENLTVLRAIGLHGAPAYLDRLGRVAQPLLAGATEDTQRRIAGRDLARICDLKAVMREPIDHFDRGCIGRKADRHAVIEHPAQHALGTRR